MSVALRTNALPRSGLVLVVALPLLWGLNWPIMKTALSEVPPLTFRSLCVASGAVGLVAGLMGLAVLMGGDLGVLSTAPLGALLVVGAAISWALGTVIVKRARPAVATSVLVGRQLAIGGLPIVLGAAWLERGALGPVSLWPALGVVYNMLVCFVFCCWA